MRITLVLILVLILEFLLKLYEEKTSYTVLREGNSESAYPNKLPTESLQLMLDLEEKEEPFEKLVFIIREKIKPS